jgi:NifB/MoaA-like Fe-S oxidoreductase
MTREDIIRMAKEAGLNPDDLAAQFLERFAELVRADEREACAKVCDDEGLHITASIIRARGQE